MFGRFVSNFNRKYDQMLMRYDQRSRKVLRRPAATVLVIMGGFVVSLALFPLLGVAFFPRTDPGQFVINVKAPTGTASGGDQRNTLRRVENDIRDVIPSDDLKMIVSNIGVNADLSAIYTSNTAQHTAFVQVSLQRRPQAAHLRLHESGATRSWPPTCLKFPPTSRPADWWTRWSTPGMPAPIDIQVAATISRPPTRWRPKFASRVRSLHDVNDVLIPQDLDYPGIQLDVRREMAARLGLTASDVVATSSRR